MARVSAESKDDEGRQPGREDGVGDGEGFEESRGRTRFEQDG